MILNSCLVTNNQVKNKVFNDAVAFWPMEKVHPENMEVHGDVIMGKRLPRNERNASNERGGTGKVAEFNGGYIDLGQGKNNALNFDGYSFSLHIRFCIKNNFTYYF